MIDNENILKQLRVLFPFDTFRPNQLEAMVTMTDKIVNQNKTNFIFEGPTGTGKSVIAWTAGLTINHFRPPLQIKSDNQKIKSTGPDILICTSSKMLQTQYMKSFSKLGLKSIWSSITYPCVNKNLKDYNVHYNSSACLGQKCKVKNKCPYLIARQEFLKANVGVTNYYFFLYSHGLKPNVLICDEAHNLNTILSQLKTFKITKEGLTRLDNLLTKHLVSNDSLKDIIIELENLIESDVDEIESKYFKNFCTIFKTKLLVIEEAIKKQLKVYQDIEDFNKLKGFKDYLTLNDLKDKISHWLEKIKDYDESEDLWIVSILDREKIQFEIKPLNIDNFVTPFIKRSNFRIYMSATICGPVQFANELKLDFDTCGYISTPNIFPIKNRQVFTTYIGSLNYKNKNEILPRFISGIDTIIKKITNDFQENVSGIIHSVSYTNAEYIKYNSKYKEFIYIPKGKELLDLNKIINGKNNRVIICSPTIVEGIDLSDDLSRFQIWLKVPFASLGDRWIKTKMTHDPKWYARETIIKIVQGCGRSIRSETDWAHTFILDSNFERLLMNNKAMFPDWFLESINNNNFIFI